MALPKRHRLRGHRAIDHLHRQGRRHQSPHLLLRVVPAKQGLLPPPDRRAPASSWRCALVISAKVNKRAVVRNRLRRLLHRHLLACLQPPIATADRLGGQDLLDLREAQSTRSDGQPPSPLMLGSSEGPLRQQAMGSAPGALALATPAASATGPTAPPGGPTDPKPGPLAEPKPQPAAAGQPAAVLPSREPPVWLMVSLRPGSAELDADQLLGECTIVLRRAGLIP